MRARALGFGRSAREVEAEIADELAAHLDLATRDLVDQGLSYDEARRQAEARFGDVRHVFGACRAIQLEDRVMLQRVLLVLVVVLAGAVLLQAYELRMERARAEESLAALHEQLVETNVRMDALLSSALDVRGVGDAVERAMAPPPDTALSPDPSARFEAAHRAADEGDLTALLVALRDPDVFVRLAAVRGLEQLGDPAAIEPLRVRLQLEDQEVVHEAVEAALFELER